MSQEPKRSNPVFRRGAKRGVFEEVVYLGVTGWAMPGDPGDVEVIAVYREAEPGEQADREVMVPFGYDARRMRLKKFEG